MEYGNGMTNQLVWRTLDNKYHDDKFQVEDDNPNVNVAILGRFVSQGERILDVGCGEGKFGYVIRKKNCELIGIDIDESACEIVQKGGNYKQTYIFNVESMDLSNINCQKFREEQSAFDKIALIDILEHVINPTAVILNVLPYLKDGGNLLISVPNINNADIFLNLLRDRFNYSEGGVLDNTHTKYFTKRSFVEWILEINDLYDVSLNCKYIGGTFGYTDYLNKVKEEYPAIYRFIQQNPYFHVIQHLFVIEYHHGKGKYDNETMRKALEEESYDLTDILERLLEGKLSELNSNSEMMILLPNEREIFEKRIQSTESGWKECAANLNEAREKIAEQDKTLITARDKIEEQELALHIARDKMKEQEIALNIAGKKIDELEETLRIAKNKIEEQDDALRIADNKIKEQMETLEDARIFQQKLQKDISSLLAGKRGI